MSSWGLNHEGRFLRPKAELSESPPLFWSHHTSPVTHLGHPLPAPLRPGPDIYGPLRSLKAPGSAELWDRQARPRTTSPTKAITKEENKMEKRKEKKKLLEPSDGIGVFCFQIIG